MGERLQVDLMTGADLETFITSSRQAYIGDRVAHGGEDRRDAQDVAAEQYAAFFPGGKPAQGHVVLAGRDARTGEHIGVLWLFERRSAAGISVFVYDVEVCEDRRKQGWGRELMRYAEQWAGERGAREIALNVFGGHTVARGLYASLGYRERSVSMAKPIASVAP